MKWFHLSIAPQSLTSRWGGAIFSHFTANKDDERHEKILLLCQFLFFASRTRDLILENINPDSLRMLMLVCATHIWCRRATSADRLVILFANARRPTGQWVSPLVGVPAFDKRSSCTWPRCPCTVYTLERPWITERTSSLCVNHESRTLLPSLIQASRRRRAPVTDVGGEFGKRLLASNEMFT